jgi:hypothetical protein
VQRLNQFVWLPTLKKRFCRVLDRFISFLKKYYERKTHNMLIIMLNPKFKSLCLVFSFIGRYQIVVMVEQYILCSWNVIITCIHRYNLIMVLLTKRMGDDNNLDFFQMTSRSTKPTKKLVKRVLLVFRQYQMDVKEIKCPLQGGINTKPCFPQLGFLLIRF